MVHILDILNQNADFIYIKSKSMINVDDWLLHPRMYYSYITSENSFVFYDRKQL